jgi:hypothetical protein
MLRVKWILSAVILAGTIASAQQSEHYRGSFNLPFEARFGNVVLQPGSYSVSTLEGASGIRVSGEKGHVAILAAGYEMEPGIAKAKMIFVDAGGTYALETFESGAMGKAIHFVVPKNATKNPRGPVERAAVKATVEVGLQ